MPPDNKNTNAKLIFHKPSGPVEISAMFNPGEYSIAKNNQFAIHNIPGTNVPLVQYVSGLSETLDFKLMFDTYTYEGGVDVRTAYIDKILDMLKIDPDLHAPPPCTFEWGTKNESFTGVIDKATCNFTMFNEKGVPVRATLTLSFKKYGGGEPTKSHSPDRTKRHLVKDGDTLWLLAAKEYGDPSKWKIIATANDIDSPLSIKSGTQLVIPPLE